MAPRVPVGPQTLLYGKQTVWRISFFFFFFSQQSDQRNKNTGCRNQALFVLLSVFLPPSVSTIQTPREGDVILRRCMHWPVRRLEGAQPRIIDSGTALKCWLSTTCPIAPQTVGSACGGGGFWHGEESFKGALGDAVTVSSHIRIQGHFSRDAHVWKKKEKKGGVACERQSLGRRRFIKTSSLVNIFLGSRMQTLSHRLSFFSTAARALSALRSRHVTPR